MSSVSAGPGNLQSAINGAAPGSTLILQDGTYTKVGDNPVALINKDLTIRAQNPGQAILDGEALQRCIKIEGGKTVHLEGLVIDNGLAKNTGGQNYLDGAGIFIDSDSGANTVSMTDCIVSNQDAFSNAADSANPPHGATAAGIYLDTSSKLTLNSCEIFGCESYNFG